MTLLLVIYMKEREDGWISNVVSCYGVREFNHKKYQYMVELYLTWLLSLDEWNSNG
jgi:hypothetical protein